MKAAKTTRYRSIGVPLDHPMRQGVSEKNGAAYGKAYQHRVVLYDKIGPGEHQCHWCGKTLAWNGKKNSRLMADHLDGDRWNNAPGNLVPACRRCNSKRAERPDFLTHCEKGHEFTPESTYYRPDGLGRVCKICTSARQEAKRTTNHRRRIKRYVACPECGCQSVRVEENGKICRHLVGRGFMRPVGTMCVASNRRAMEKISREDAS